MIGTQPLSLQDIEDLSERALEEHGLTALGWTFSWDRAVRRAGACAYSRRRISLSRPIFEIEANRREALDTILHEVAHALAGPEAGHGPGWRRFAHMLGAPPHRCHELATPELPIIGTCECGSPHERARFPHDRFVCRTCSRPITWSAR